ncbi:MAG: ATP-binding cassette domain-containing protein, partial [Anaerolineae bacterium]|nr:ATP-binding cassette domain-containing protein [Anaerolineae bacterium]
MNKALALWTPASLSPSKPDVDPERLIELHGVTKVYQSSAGKFSALKGVDLKFAAGEFVAIVGKSGSGKTTLINVLTG